MHKRQRAKQKFFSKKQQKTKKTIDKGQVIYYNVTKGELYIINY